MHVNKTSFGCKLKIFLYHKQPCAPSIYSDLDSSMQQTCTTYFAQARINTFAAGVWIYLYLEIILKSSIFHVC